MFTCQSLGFRVQFLLVDSLPVVCASSRKWIKRSALGEAAGYGRTHTRWHWGLRLHHPAAPEGAPRAFLMADPRCGEREVALELLDQAARGSKRPVRDKNHAGHHCATAARKLRLAVARPRWLDEPGAGPHPAPILQRIDSTS